MEKKACARPTNRPSSLIPPQPHLGKDSASSDSGSEHVGRNTRSDSLASSTDGFRLPTPKSEEKEIQVVK